jgi:hypothetical protein
MSTPIRWVALISDQRLRSDFGCDETSPEGYSTPHTLVLDLTRSPCRLDRASYLGHILDGTDDGGDCHYATVGKTVRWWMVLRI